MISLPSSVDRTARHLCGQVCHTIHGVPLLTDTLFREQLASGRTIGEVIFLFDPNHFKSRLLNYLGTSLTYTWPVGAVFQLLFF